jgi:hypothetical protein
VFQLNSKFEFESYFRLVIKKSALLVKIKFDWSKIF